MDSIRQQLNEVEYQHEKMMERNLKDLELKENLENLQNMPAKVKAL